MSVSFSVYLLVLVFFLVVFFPPDSSQLCSVKEPLYLIDKFLQKWKVF